jgi:helicase
VEELQIDERLKAALIQEEIVDLYPPQAEAIQLGLLGGKNFVVAIPTASGKTLIAILAMITRLLQRGGKAVYLAPLKALASEKYMEIKELAETVGLRVSISTGDPDDRAPWLGSSDIIIATNEKFDSLIRHQVSWLNDIQVIVSDEVHLINDAHRGPVLEVVLSLVRQNLPDCQIVALSATIINADEIAEWIDAELVLSSWRPVQLREGVWHSGSLKYSNGQKVAAGLVGDKDGYVSLTSEIVEQGGQALIFANTRKSAMTSAGTAVKGLRKLISANDTSDLRAIAKDIRSKGEKTEIRERLAKVVELGGAFHHAGLAAAHRKIIEDAFRERKIKVIASTPSLAAGVNLPGRRVIIRSLSRYSMGFGYSPIPVLEYKQMAGRAGRPRFDPYGEAIVIAKNENDVNHVLDRYVRAETEEIYSKLGTEPALRSHLLAFIAALH